MMVPPVLCVDWYGTTVQLSRDDASLTCVGIHRLAMLLTRSAECLPIFFSFSL